MLKLFLIFIVTFQLFSFTLQDLEKMPKSIERDFFIWRFISDKNTTKEDAIKAIKLRKTLNAKLKNAFYKKTSIKLTPPKQSSYNKKTIQEYQKTLEMLKRAPNFYQAWLQLDDKKALEFFTLAGSQNRALLNKSIPSSKLIAMSHFYRFNEFLYRVQKENLKNIMLSIWNTKFPRKSKISYKNLMKIAFLALQEQKNSTAFSFFRLAYFKAKSRFAQDRTLFWLYMSSKNKKFLQTLSKSYDFNIYKLLALDFLNLPYPSPTPIPKLPKKKNSIDITNPIEWAKLKEKIFKKNSNLDRLAQEYASQDTLAYYLYIQSKASRYKKQFFPFIYSNYIQNYSLHRQALILALAKQESQFIPAAISRSFAVGLMQFMPFLIKDMAKKKKENITLEDMFHPEVAIKYAATHLDYLEKYLYNPFLVAYAYNGGIGFTRRLVRNKKFFQKKEYEPYLSMELVPNLQANIYAKKVIANYAIYRKLLGSPIRVSTILKELIESKAHKF